MKRYSIFHPLVLSFFSGSLYRDVGQRWRGTGLAYLLFVLALCWIPTVIKMQFGLTQFVDHDSVKITQQIPAITISHGKVSTDVATPYFIKDPDTGNDLVIIDTTGKYEKLSDAPPKGFLLTKSKIITSNSAETRAYDLSGVDSFFLDRARVEGWLATARHWFVFAAYPLLVAFSFVFRATQALIYALVGLLFAHLLNVRLDYKTLLRLTAVSLTPVLVLDLIFEFVPLRIPLWNLLGIGVGLGYLFFAVKANSGSETVSQDGATWSPQNS
jgi:hypothetical protein